MVKCQMVDDGPVVLALRPEVDVEPDSDATRRHISDAEKGYWWYRRVVNNRGDQAATVPADVVADNDDIFAHEVLWET